MRAPDKITTYLLEILTPLGPVSARRMFGGVGLFLNGVMFALIAREELYFKAGDNNRAAFQAAGELPFTYDTKNGSHTIGSYWRCPPELLDDAETFRECAKGAIEASTSAARTKPKRPRQTRP